MSPETTFNDHIKEFRWRLLWVMLAIILSAGIAYIIRIRLIDVLLHPLSTPVYYTSPAGSFNFVLKLSVVIGVFIALPVAIYQILRFIEPALPIKIKKGLMIKIIGSSFMLALIGIAFAFFLMVPMSLKFFGGYSTDNVKPLINANEYLSFVLNHLLTFAVAFQIPMIFLFINRIKPLKPSTLLKYQRHVIVAAFGIAIVLPFTYDPLSQFIVAVPIVFLYYLSIVLLWIVNRKHVYAVEPEKVTNEVKIHNTPVVTPVAMPQVATTVPRTRLSMDGFVAAHKLRPQPAAVPQPIKTSLVAPKQKYVTHRVPNRGGRPKFSIDGISPALT